MKTRATLLREYRQASIFAILEAIKQVSRYGEEAYDCKDLIGIVPELEEILHRVEDAICHNNSSQVS